MQQGPGPEPGHGHGHGPRDVLVVGGELAGACAALAAVRSGARVRLVLQAAPEPRPGPAFPDDPSSLAEAAVKQTGLALPDEGPVFRFRARRVRRWLDELGVSPDEGWANALRQAVLDRCQREGVALDRTSVAVRLIHGASSVSGAVLVDGSDCETHPAATTILAGGGAGFLWPGADRAAPPCGLALAQRAGIVTGDPSRVAWVDQEDNGDAGVRALRFIQGLRGDGRGQVGIPGLAACGEALASPLHSVPELCHVEDAVRGLEAGGFHAPPGAGGDAELVPLVDEPMPPGFAGVKMQRLRAVMGKFAGPEADEADLARGHAEVLSLRGEFADYARARADTEVHLLHQAADVALAHVTARLETVRAR